MRLDLVSSAAAAALLAVAAPAAASTTVVVPGYSDPFLAGQPDGTSCCGDTAPDQSPVLATSVVAGETLTFTATGGVSYAGGTPAPGADGDNDGTDYTYRYSMTVDPGTGIAGAQNVNVDGLVGVFLGSGVPSGPAPAPLDFSGTAGSTGLDFTSLAPGLNQIFWIGDGLTGIGTGTRQTFTAPTGATRLFLGTVDGCCWYNNTGAITVTIDTAAGAVPEPASWAMAIAGIGLVGGAMRSRRMGAATRLA